MALITENYLNNGVISIMNKSDNILCVKKEGYMLKKIRPNNDSSISKKIKLVGGIRK